MLNSKIKPIEGILELWLPLNAWIKCKIPKNGYLHIYVYDVVGNQPYLKAFEYKRKKHDKLNKFITTTLYSQY